jgi:hypothetical protein
MVGGKDKRREVMLGIIVAKQGAVTLVGGAPAVQIVPADATRTNLFLSTPGAVYIGGSDLTAANGFPLTAGEAFALPSVGCQAAIFAGSPGDYVINWMTFAPSIL